MGNIKYSVKGTDRALYNISGAFLHLTHDDFIIFGSFGPESCSIESSILDVYATYQQKDKILTISGNETDLMRELIETEFNRRNLNIKLDLIN